MKGARWFVAQALLLTLLHPELLTRIGKNKMQVMGSGKSQLGFFLCTQPPYFQHDAMGLLELFQVYTVEKEGW